MRITFADDNAHVIDTDDIKHELVIAIIDKKVEEMICDLETQYNSLYKSFYQLYPKAAVIHKQKNKPILLKTIEDIRNNVDNCAYTIKFG